MFGGESILVRRGQCGYFTLFVCWLYLSLSKGFLYKHHKITAMTALPSKFSFNLLDNFFKGDHNRGRRAGLNTSPKAAFKATAPGGKRPRSTVRWEARGARGRCTALSFPTPKMVV